MNEQTLQAILKFREERGWAQFHAPKNLAMSVAIEAAELMEVFQWAEAVPAGSISKDDRDRALDEIADVAIYLALLAHDMEIDLDSAIMEKVEKNARKYPVANFYGAYRSDEESDVKR
jgi:NTP pyrophosphatase (non-canonical NTP hydrolase)